LIANAIKTVTPSIVRVYSDDSDAPEFLALGVVLDASGTMATDMDSLGERSSVQVELSDGTSVSASVISRDMTTGLSYLAPATSTQGVTWAPASIASTIPDLGQSVVMLTGEKSPEIAAGLVTALDQGSGTPDAIDTDIDPSFILHGSPLINTDGAIVGVSTGVSRASLASAFIPASLILPNPQ
jgi:S1-C subfamily serine protease